MEGYRNKRIDRIILWFCTGVLSLVLVGIMVSCATDAEGSGGTGDKKPDALTATYYDVGDDCDAIKASEQHAPKDTAKLRRLIKKDIKDQGADVNLNYIDTSGITDMSSLFEIEEGATFNGAIHCWNVSKVTDMSAMFKGTTVFNQDIRSWDVRAVTTMESMFDGAEAFEQNLTAWGEHVQLMVDTASMFAAASKLAGVPNWKKSDGTRVCFDHTANINVMENKGELRRKISDLITADELSPNLNHLETCNVEDMSDLFISNNSLNGDISQWDVSNVTSMYKMFEKEEAFDGDISNWDVSKVTNMAYMFEGAKAFKNDISGWKVGKVENMRNMFSNANAFNVAIGRWDTSSVEDMRYMFYNTLVFNKPIGEWKVGNVKNMEAMFWSAVNFNQNVTKWDVSKVTNMKNMFRESNFCNGDVFNETLSEWGDKIKNTPNIILTDMFTDLKRSICAGSYPPQWYTDLMGAS